MKEQLLPFFKAVNTVNSGVFGREVLIRHAVALAVSDLSPLPSSEVENTEVAFNNYARLRAEDIVAEFNEGVTVNVLATINLVRAYWTARYRHSIGAARVFTAGQDFVQVVAGLADAVSPEDLKTINDAAGDFGFLYSEARRTIQILGATTPAV